MRSLTGIHLPETLSFVASEDYFSVYRTRDGEEVYLAHGTAQRLVDFDELDLRTLWSRHLYTHHPWDQEPFREMLRGLTHETEMVDNDLGFCEDCGVPDHDDDQYETTSGSVCSRCVENYRTCDHCNDMVRSITWTLGDYGICNVCRDESYSYCDHCDGYYRDDGDEDHDHGGRGCTCESPAQQFRIRNDGDEPLANDTFATVSLPAGVISDEGLYEIANYIRGQAYNQDDIDARQKWMALSYQMETVGPNWQTKQGNFTKRLSRLAYKTYNLKLPPEVISHVGNIARDHSTAVDHQIAVTRQLNLSPEEFAHEESCWWQSYASSRCALKSNGGFGLRAFHVDGWVTGRAWVLPLKQSNGFLTPTFETESPDAFMVFNGYGTLSGYTAARIMSHMAGWTYRKVEFRGDPMYVNSESGYMVAPEEIADPYTDGDFELSLETHSNLYAREKREPAHV
jgi:hypothetical protein